MGVIYQGCHHVIHHLFHKIVGVHYDTGFRTVRLQDYGWESVHDNRLLQQFTDNYDCFLSTRYAIIFTATTVYMLTKHKMHAAFFFSYFFIQFLFFYFSFFVLFLFIFPPSLLFIFIFFSSFTFSFFVFFPVIIYNYNNFTRHVLYYFS